VGKIVSTLREHSGNLDEFLTRDPKGSLLIDYMGQLSEHLATEREDMLKELDSLTGYVEHIKEIVAMQQSYAKTTGGVLEVFPVLDVVEDALRVNTGTFERHQVETVRDFQKGLPNITTDKHKVLQILINLLRNAKYACDDANRPDKRVIVRVRAEGGRIHIQVIDNGIGIPAENLTRIFNHGFTTRTGGHGFGLHSGALAAKELGGQLRVQSEGPGRGATFTLELPLQAEEETAQTR
jgi:signal transduction histidine kinase